MKTTSVKSFLLFLLLLSITPVQAETLTITDAWIKNLPPVVPMRAGYMQIENKTNRSVVIVALESEVFTAVDIHETVEKNGMMSMQPMPSLNIAAGASTQLSPGGIHLMMMNPKKALKPGDEVAVSLQFGDGSKQTIRMTVRQ